jgi:hypothetical protein
VPRAIYKPEIGQLIVPMHTLESIAHDLVVFLDELVPEVQQRSA